MTPEYAAQLVTYLTDRIREVGAIACAVLLLQVVQAVLLIGTIERLDARLKKLEEKK